MNHRSLWEDESEKGKQQVFLYWHFVFEHLTAVVSLSLTCIVSEEKSVVIFIPVSEWVLGIVHLLLRLEEFCLMLCKLVFSQRPERTPVLIPGARSPLTNSPLSTLPSRLQLPSSSWSGSSSQWSCYALFGVALSAQWSGNGPQSEWQGSRRA